MNIIKQEKGQGLVVTLLLGGILALVAWALTQSLTHDMKMTVKTQSEDNNFSLGDEGLQKTISLITRVSNGSDLWDTADNLTNYASLTFSAHTIMGGKMWVKVRKGDLVDKLGNGASDDAAVATWANQGDLNLDRTIFVRTHDNTTGKESRFVGVIHRNPIVTPIPGYAITGSDKIKIEAESGGPLGMNTINSCGSVSNQGSMAAPEIKLELVGAPTIFPTIITSTTPIASPTPISTPTPGGVPAVQAVTGCGCSITGTWDGACNFTLGPADPAVGFAIYQIDALKFAKDQNCTMTIDASNGPIQLYIINEFEIDGGDNGFSSNVKIINAPSCCTSSYFQLFLGSGGGGDDGTKLKMEGSGSFMGTVIGGPGSQVKMEGEKGAFTFTGKITGGKVKIEAKADGGTPGAANVNYDMCIDRRRVENYEEPPVVITRWKQLSD